MRPRWCLYNWEVLFGPHLSSPETLQSSRLNASSTTLLVVLPFVTSSVLASTMTFWFSPDHFGTPCRWPNWKQIFPRSAFAPSTYHALWCMESFHLPEPSRDTGFLGSERVRPVGLILRFPQTWEASLGRPRVARNKHILHNVSLKQRVGLRSKHIWGIPCVTGVKSSESLECWWMKCGSGCHCMDFWGTTRWRHTFIHCITDDDLHQWKAKRNC